MDKIKIVSIGDIHCGHKRNCTRSILRAMDKAFLNGSDYLKDVDLFLICGDFFDRLLDLTHPDLGEIDIWIANFFAYCAKYNVIVRVLEGTPSHDWKQSERFVTISEILDNPVDFKYVHQLSIEYIEKLDIHMLYVPDEWDPSVDNTLKQVKELIKSKGLQQVDFACMHGAFEYQLPPVVKNVPLHSSKEYLNLVKYLIFIGHIHIFSQNDRIIAQGSFDRLAHGEEGPKGWVEAVIQKDGTYTCIHRVNDLARIYKTITLQSTDMKESLLEIERFVEEEIPTNDACVRIEAVASHPVFTDFATLVRKYPTIQWSKKAIEEEHEEIEITDEITYTPVTITRENIRTFIVDRLTNKQYDKETITSVDALLEEIITS